SLLPATTLGPADPSAAHDDGHAAAGGTAHEDHADAHHHVVRHRFAGVSSFVGPAVLALSFLLSLVIWLDFRRAGAPHEAFVQTYFAWMPAGDLSINAALM